MSNPTQPDPIDAAMEPEGMCEHWNYQEPHSYSSYCQYGVCIRLCQFCHKPDLKDLRQETDRLIATECAKARLQGQIYELNKVDPMASHELAATATDRLVKLEAELQRLAGGEAGNA